MVFIRDATFHAQALFSAEMSSTSTSKCDNKYWPIFNSKIPFGSGTRKREVHLQQAATDRNAMTGDVELERGNYNCPLLRDRFLKVWPVDEWKAKGFLKENDTLLERIPCHWLQFDPVKPSVHFGLALVYVIYFIVGIFGNGLVIYIIASSKRLLTSANILIANLAVSDSIIICIVPMFIFNSLHHGPVAGSLGCSIYGFLSGLSGTCSIMSLTAVAVERYMVLSRPLKLSQKPTRRGTVLVVLLLWIYSSIFALIPFTGITKGYVPEGYLTSCSFDYLSIDFADRVFILAYFIGAWLIPLIVIMYSYSVIVWTVVHVRRNVVTATRACISDEENQHETLPVAVPAETIDPSNINGLQVSVITPINSSQRVTRRRVGIKQKHVEIAITKTVLGLIGLWVIAWTPYAFVSLAGIFGHVELLTPFNTMLPALFAKLAACIDPFVYSLNHPKIRFEIMCRLQNYLYPTKTEDTTLVLATGSRRRLARGSSTIAFCPQPADAANSQSFIPRGLSDSRRYRNSSSTIPSQSSRPRCRTTWRDGDIRTLRASRSASFRPSVPCQSSAKKDHNADRHDPLRSDKSTRLDIFETGTYLKDSRRSSSLCELKELHGHHQPPVSAITRANGTKRLSQQSPTIAKCGNGYTIAFHEPIWKRSPCL